MILTQRYAELLWNDRLRLIILLLQPCLIAILLNIVADENVFNIYESTKSILFALSCSGIWIGMFDSIQEICKERVILKREYMANLKLPCYMMSKFVLQMLLGMVQAVTLTMVFLTLTKSKEKGIFLRNFRIEILFTIWLTVVAAIAMGFIISSIAKSGDKAMTAAPFVLIIQLLFSGILFNLEGMGKKISYCTVSRWSVEALGSIARLNKLELKMQADFPMLEHKAGTGTAAGEQKDRKFCLGKTVPRVFARRHCISAVPFRRHLYALPDIRKSTAYRDASAANVSLCAAEKKHHKYKRLFYQGCTAAAGDVRSFYIPAEKDPGALSARNTLIVPKLFCR